MPHEPAAITITGTVQHEAWRDRVLPPVEEVRPGLWSVPTPFAGPLRYVLAYLVETRTGVALVDTGWPSEDAWDGLVEGVRQTGHDITDIDAVLVTHGHADHFGLARRVREASGARVALHTLDAKAAQNWSSLSDFARVDTAWLVRRGVALDEVAGMVPQGEGPVGMLGEADVQLEDGDRPMGAGTPLRVLWTPGHTPGHICFVHEEHDVLLTGDHILPRISPNISPSPANAEDTLGEYLHSLLAMAELEVSEVLPAHEYRFYGLPARVAQLLAHHAHRLSEIMDAVGSGMRAGGHGPTTLAVAEALTWSRPWSQSQGIVRRSAIGETYAHLIHLSAQGLVANCSADIDDWRLSDPRSATTDSGPAHADLTEPASRRPA